MTNKNNDKTKLNEYNKNLDNLELENNKIDLSDLENGKLNKNNSNKYNKQIDLGEFENNLNSFENACNKEMNISINLSEIENKIIFFENENLDDDLNIDNINVIMNIQNNLSNKYKSKTECKKNIYIYGCSHCKCFTRNNIKIGNITIVNKFKSGASMSGIVNDISTLNYKPDIDKNIHDNKNDIHLFKFGQVDIEYIFLYKTIIKNLDIDKLFFYNDIIDKYVNYLKKYISNESENILVCGSNLTNPYNWEKYVKHILKIDYLPDDMTYQSKNSDILTFNNILKNKCEKNNIIYVDTINECTIKKENDIIVKDIYIGKDHHYKGAEMSYTFNKEIIKDKNYGNKTYYAFINELLKNI